MHECEIGFFLQQQTEKLNSIVANVSILFAFVTHFVKPFFLNFSPDVRLLHQRKRNAHLVNGCFKMKFTFFAFVCRPTGGQVNLFRKIE